MENEDKFIDAEQYQGGQKFELNFRMIVLQHLKRIGDLMSVEMRGGYYEQTPNMIGGSGTYSQTYIPDTRETLSNAISYLSHILFPHFDEGMKKAEEEIKKEWKEEFSKLKETHIDQRAIIDSWKHSQAEIKKKLFRHLCSFLYRIKYLELGSIEE